MLCGIHYMIGFVELFFCTIHFFFNNTSWICANTTLGLPSLCSLDVEVVKYLPPEIISEINDIYKGELHHFMEAHEDVNRSIKSCKHTISLPEQGDNSLASSGQAAISDVGGHIAYELNDSVAGALKKGKLPGGYSEVAISSIATQRKVSCLSCILCIS